MVPFLISKFSEPQRERERGIKGSNGNHSAHVAKWNNCHDVLEGRIPLETINAVFGIQLSNENV